MRQNIEALAIRDSQASSSSSYEDSDEIFRLELSMDKHILQLIQTACKADKLPRALDAARMLNSVKSIDSAVQIAAFYHLPGLKEKITALREVKERQIRKREDDERRARYGGSSSSSRYVPPPTSTSMDFFDAPAAPPKSNRNPLEFAPRPVGGKRTFAAPAIVASPATSSVPPLSSRPYDSTPSTAAQNYDDDYDDDEDLAPIGNGDEEDGGGMDMDEDEDESSDREGAAAAAAAKRKRDVAEKENGGFAPMPEKKKRNSLGSSSLDSVVSAAPSKPGQHAFCLPSSFRTRRRVNRPSVFVSSAPQLNPFARKKVDAAAAAAAAASEFRILSSRLVSNASPLKRVSSRTKGRISDALFLSHRRSTRSLRQIQPSQIRQRRQI